MTATISKQYCTLEDVRDAANLGSGFVAANPQYEMGIEAASRFIDQVTGRRFYPDKDDTQVRKFLPTSSGYCIIDDLNTLTSLADRDGDVWTRDQDFVLLPINAAADGQPYTAVRALSRPFLFSQADIPASSWSILDGRITITGNFGWETCPGDIKLACALLTNRYVTRFREAPLGIYTAGVDNPSIRLSRSDPDVYNLLQPYMLSFVV